HDWHHATTHGFDECKSQAFPAGRHGQNLCSTQPLLWVRLLTNELDHLVEPMLARQVRKPFPFDAIAHDDTTNSAAFPMEDPNGFDEEIHSLPRYECSNVDDVDIAVAASR